jgi:hypothetical protein
MKFKFTGIAVKLCAALAFASPVQAQDLPGIASFFQYPSIGIVSLSPDDSQVAMTIRAKDGRVALATC